MRDKLEALCKRWEAQSNARYRGRFRFNDGISHAELTCAADLRALLSEPERVRMEPQPEHWSEKNKPGRVDARFNRPCLWAANAKPWTSDLEVEFHEAPSPTHRPVLVDGVWWWEVQS